MHFAVAQARPSAPARHRPPPNQSNPGPKRLHGGPRAACRSEHLGQRGNRRGRQRANLGQGQASPIGNFFLLQLGDQTPARPACRSPPTSPTRPCERPDRHPSRPSTKSVRPPAGPGRCGARRGRPPAAPSPRVGEQRGQRLHGRPSHRSQPAQGMGGMRPEHRRRVLQLLAQNGDDLGGRVTSLAQSVDCAEACRLVARILPRRAIPPGPDFPPPPRRRKPIGPKSKRQQVAWTWSPPFSFCTELRPSLRACYGFDKPDRMSIIPRELLKGILP